MFRISIGFRTNINVMAVVRRILPILILCALLYCPSASSQGLDKIVAEAVQVANSGSILNSTMIQRNFIIVRNIHPPQPSATIQTSPSRRSTLKPARVAYGHQVRDTTTLPAYRTSSKLPDYKLKILTENACQALNTKNCRLLSSANCQTGYYDYSCSSSATTVEIKVHLNKIKRALPESAIVLGLFGERGLEADNFRVISANILRMHIHEVLGLDCDKLKDLPLPNLLQLDILDGKAITIGRDSFAGFRKLRMLAFRVTTIKSIEEGAFESLADLQMLALDWGITAPFTEDIKEHLFRFHCEEEYAWLRDYLKEKPELLESRRDGAVYSVNGISNWSFQKRDIFHNVDCSHEDLTGKFY